MTEELSLIRLEERILKLEDEYAEQERKSMIYELATSILLTDMAKILDTTNRGVLDTLIKSYQAGEENISELDAAVQTHTKEVFKRIQMYLNIAKQKS